MGQLQKSPSKSGRWDLFPVPDYKMMSTTTNNFLFAKKEWPEKTLYVLFEVSWQFDPGLNPNIISASRPRPMQLSTVGPGHSVTSTLLPESADDGFVKIVRKRKVELPG
jgi:hypothetical protein